jgi:hypothetical protein
LPIADCPSFIAALWRVDNFSVFGFERPFLAFSLQPSAFSPSVVEEFYAPFVHFCGYSIGRGLVKTLKLKAKS